MQGDHTCESHAILCSKLVYDDCLPSIVQLIGPAMDLDKFLWNVLHVHGRGIAIMRYCKRFRNGKVRGIMRMPQINGSMYY